MLMTPATPDLKSSEMSATKCATPSSKRQLLWHFTRPMQTLQCELPFWHELELNKMSSLLGIGATTGSPRVTSWTPFDGEDPAWLWPWR